MSPLALPSPVAGLASGSEVAAVVGTGLSVPSGVDQPISYNGLIMNNRRWIDTIIIDKIDGLRDSEIRDDRENNPDSDGETAYEAFYGGKTFTLTGRIRAFNMDKLRDIEQAFVQAFYDIKTEKAMTFYSRNSAAVATIMCKKGAELALADEQTNGHDFTRPFMLTMKASSGLILGRDSTFQQKNLGMFDDFTADLLVGDNYSYYSPGFAVSGGYLRAPDSDGRHIFISKIYSDATATVEYRVGSGGTTGSWVRLYAKVDLEAMTNIYAEVTDDGILRIGCTHPDMGGILANASGTFSRANGSNNWLELKTVGNVITANAYSQDPRVVPGATVLKTCSFTLATDPQKEAWGEDVAKIFALYFEASTTSPLEWGLTNLSVAPNRLNGYPVLSLGNAGNADSQPVIKLNGQMESPIIINSANFETLSLTKNGGAFIAADDYFEIDIAGDTLVDASGNRQWKKLTLDSDWLVIAPGVNEINLTASDIAVVKTGGDWYLPSISFLYRSTWV